MNANINEDELGLLAFLHEHAGGYDHNFPFQPKDLMQALGWDLQRLAKNASFLAQYGLIGMKTSDTSTFAGHSFILVYIWLAGQGENFMRELEEKLSERENQPGRARKITIAVVKESWTVIKTVAISVLTEYLQSHV